MVAHDSLHRLDEIWRNWQLQLLAIQLQSVNKLFKAKQSTRIKVKVENYGGENELK